MNHVDVAAPARAPYPAGDRDDRSLVRHMLSLTPAERLRTLSAFWPLISVGLRRRGAVGGVRRP